MPLPVGSMRPMVAFAAMMASVAEPPCLRMSSATWVTSGWLVQAIACGAMVSDRVANPFAPWRLAAGAEAVNASRVVSKRELRFMGAL